MELHSYIFFIQVEWKSNARTFIHVLLRQTLSCSFHPFLILQFKRYKKNGKPLSGSRFMVVFIYLILIFGKCTNFLKNIFHFTEKTILFVPRFGSKRF